MPEDDSVKPETAPPEQECKKKRPRYAPLNYWKESTARTVGKRTQVKIPGKPSVSRRQPSQAVKLSSIGREASDALRKDTLAEMDLAWQAIDDGTFTMDDYFVAEQHLAVLTAKLNDGPNKYFQEQLWTVVKTLNSCENTEQVLVIEQLLVIGFISLSLALKGEFS